MIFAILIHGPDVVLVLAGKNIAAANIAVIMARCSKYRRFLKTTYYLC